MMLIDGAAMDRVTGVLIGSKFDRDATAPTSIGPLRSIDVLDDDA